MDQRQGGGGAARRPSQGGRRDEVPDPQRPQPAVPANRPLPRQLQADDAPLSHRPQHRLVCRSVVAASDEGHAHQRCLRLSGEPVGRGVGRGHRHQYLLSVLQGPTAGAAEGLVPHGGHRVGGRLSGSRDAAAGDEDLPPALPCRRPETLVIPAAEALPGARPARQQRERKAHRDLLGRGWRPGPHTRTLRQQTDRRLCGDHRLPHHRAGRRHLPHQRTA